MSYKIKNTLFLLVILLIVIFVSILGNSNSVRELKRVRKKHKELEKIVTEVRIEVPEESDEQIKDALDKLEKALAASKLIVKEDNPTFTYTYLMHVCSNYCPNMTFDFRHVKSAKASNTSYNEYAITGEVDIKSLYTFIYHIENQPKLYTIESLNIKEQLIDKNKLNFSLNLRTYFTDSGTELEDIPMKNLKYKNIRYNPFLPRIHKPLRSEKEEKYLNVDTAVLAGLSPKVAFLYDAKGVIKTLEPGNKVAYGYLSRINWEEQSVTFIINRIGIPTKRTISMNKD